MKIHRLPTHSEFWTPDGKRHFGSVWEVELASGEATQPQSHDVLEEIYCFVEGEGEIVVANRKKPVFRGEVITIPRMTSHWVENNSRGLLRCLAIEGPPGTAGAEEAEPAKATVGELEKAIHELPGEMDQVAAIKNIVSLFDIAGKLSEQIERAFGLDNEEGVEALGKIEKRIMDAVVEITRRYEKHAGPFGGRLGLS